MRGWRRLKAQLAYRREKSKQQHTAHPEFAGFCLLTVALLGSYCTVRPHDAGIAGAMIARSALRALGRGVFVVWVLLGYRGIRLLFHREERRPWRYLLVDALLVLAFCAVLTSFGLIFLDINPGGMTGRLFADLLSQLFGRGGALFVSASILGALSLWRSGKRPGELLRWFGERLLQDWREWRDAVAVEKSKRGESSRKKSFPKVAPSIDAGANGRGHEIEPPIVRLRPEKPVAPAVYAPPVVPAKAVKRGEAQLAEAAAGNGEAARMEPFRSPGLDLLKASDGRPHVEKEADLLASAQLLEKTLADFGVQGKVVEIHPGPIITRFDYSPAPGTKVQSVATLSNDIALAMRAMSVRIVAPIPGKAAVGIELPNPHRAVVRLREVFECADYQNHKSKLALGLGKDAEGHPVVGDMATMPHLLIAGSTGSGKSVCIHSLVMSLMFRSTPDEVKLLMIDPKRLELPLYNGIPYLYDPNQNPDNVRVITDSKEAAKALEGMIKVMDHRFKKFASVMARDIMHYNEKMAAEGRPAEPFIVIIIDELADLMAVAPKEVEGSIQRLTQMARAVGIHMVLATQRPSVDVITGVIKANLPARIAFRVSSQTDSRVILDTSGAESLLGQGDMLFLPPGAPKPARLQCGLVTSQEVQTIADFVRAQGKPAYERILSPVAGAGTPGDPAATEELDDLQQALMLVLERRRVSQDLLKAHFGSSATATDLLSLLEVKGFISKPEGTNRWTIFYDRIDAYLGQLKNQAPSA